MTLPLKHSMPMIAKELYITSSNIKMLSMRRGGEGEAGRKREKGKRENIEGETERERGRGK